MKSIFVALVLVPCVFSACGDSGAGNGRLADANEAPDANETPSDGSSARSDHPSPEALLSAPIDSLAASESGTPQLDASTYPVDGLAPQRDVPLAVSDGAGGSNGTVDGHDSAGSGSEVGGNSFDAPVVTSGATGTTDVYIAGYSSANSFIAGYWKNGVATAVTDGTNNAVAYAVYVSGGDVYVAGYEEDGEYYVLPGQNPVRYRVAKVWKNGVPTSLTDGKYNSEAHAVVVSGTDVYVAGLEGTSNYPTGGYNGFHTATVWKNNVGTALSSPSGYGQAYAVAVSGKDVYVAGYQQPDSNSYVAATYWKNGSAVPLTAGTSSAQALGIAVGGGNVYVVGYEEPAGGGASAAKIWKNGVATTLTGGDQATGIVLSGTDVLVSGSQGYSAMLWQNGQGIPLNAAQGDGVAQALGLAVAGSSIYLCGTYNNKAAYWDNNKVGWHLTDGKEPQSSANGIFVVAH